MPYIPIFLSGLAIMTISLSGVLFMWHGFRESIQENLKFLVTFAIGVFSITLYMLFNETLHLEASLGSVALGAAAGALFLEILQRCIPEAHHHHGANKEDCGDMTDSHTEHRINSKRILLGDAVHNITDGVLIVPAFLLNVHIGISVTLGIILHELVQEISEFFILKEAGYSTKKALLSNFLVSSTIFIGIGLSLFISTATDYTHLLIAFASGSILYIIIRDLLPHTLVRIKNEGQEIKHLIILLLGGFLMFVSSHILPHTHDIHEDAHEHSSTEEHIDSHDDHEH